MVISAILGQDVELIVNVFNCLIRENVDLILCIAILREEVELIVFCIFPTIFWAHKKSLLCTYC